MERLLSLDISSKCVGFGVFDDASLRTYGKFRQVGDEHGERLLNFSKWLQKMLAKYKPKQVVFEAPYAGRRRNTYGVLMLYVGVILAVHFDYFDHEVQPENRIQPSVVKRALKVPSAASHEERKALMVAEINRLYHLNLVFKAKDTAKKVSDDDTADGIAVGRAWLIRNRNLT